MNRKSDWEIFKAIAKKFSKWRPKYLGVETDVVQLPLLHDTAAELAQAHVKDWKKGECDLIPGKTAPNYIAVERDYPNLYKKFTSIGPLLEKLGNGGKGINWDTKTEVAPPEARPERRGAGRGRVEGPAAAGYRHRRGRDDPDAGAGNQRRSGGQGLGGAGKAHRPLDHAHLAEGAHHTKIRFRDIAAQPRKIISSPTWSGIESEDRLLQRRLHQRPRTDPVAHPDRATAAVSGSPVDAGLWRRFRQLPPAGRSEDHHRGRQQSTRPRATRMWC
jgi:nitrate reductase alpha subunit